MWMKRLLQMYVFAHKWRACVCVSEYIYWNHGVHYSLSFRICLSHCCYTIYRKRKVVVGLWSYSFQKQLKQIPFNEKKNSRTFFRSHIVRIIKGRCYDVPNKTKKLAIISITLEMSNYFDLLIGIYRFFLCSKKYFAWHFNAEECRLTVMSIILIVSIWVLVHNAFACS